MGIGAVTFGTEGLLDLMELQFPVGTSAKLRRATLVDSRNRAASEFAGAAILGAPGITLDQVTQWTADGGFGARTNLSAMSGSLSVAARVRFLFFSQTFRHLLTSWPGVQFARSDWIGNWPIANERPTPDPTVDLGQFSDAFAYSEIPLVGNTMLQGTFALDAVSLCVPVDVVK